MINNKKTNKPQVGCPTDPKNLSDRNWIRDHLTIALQRESDENLVKRLPDFADIEEYLILIFDGPDESYSLKVTPDLLDNAGFPEDDAWHAAERNLEQSVRILSLQSMLPEDVEPVSGSEGGDRIRIYVATTAYRAKGAAAILCRDKLNEFMEQHEMEKLVILPSSIHETLIFQYLNYMDMDYFSQLVKKINASQVAPEEQLADWAYLYME